MLIGCTIIQCNNSIILCGVKIATAFVFWVSSELVLENEDQLLDSVFADFRLRT